MRLFLILVVLLFGLADISDKLSTIITILEKAT